MKKISIDQMKFDGKQSVLDRINEPSFLDRINLFLNRELEVPVAGIIAAVACAALILMYVPGKEPVDIYRLKDAADTYPIIVIEEGGNYEVY